MNLKKFKYLLNLLFFISGYLVAHYISNNNLKFKPEAYVTGTIKKHTIINKKTQKSIKVTILGNPTCSHCEMLFKNIVSKIHKQDISLDYIFYPANNLDVWLCGLTEYIFEKNNNHLKTSNLSDANLKLQFFNLLKTNKSKWENLETIKELEDVLFTFSDINKFLTKKDFKNFVANYENYIVALQYYTFIKTEYKVEVLPSINISVTLKGNVPEQRISKIIHFLKAEYQANEEELTLKQSLFESH